MDFWIKIAHWLPMLNQRFFEIPSNSFFDSIDPKLTLGAAHALASAHAARQSKGGDCKDLPLKARIQFSHLHTNALKFRACGARGEVGVACGCVGEGAL